jgi:hypothetical protein
VLWGRAVQEREESYRLYSCRGCSVSVSICGPCDHGNIFCPGECAAISRRASNRRAGARYQRTRRGARRHAARQQEWRERERKKVTQQGCAPVAPVFTMSITVDVAAIETSDAPCTPEQRSAAAPTSDHGGQRQVRRCDFCRAPLPAFTRLRTWRGWGFG